MILFLLFYISIYGGVHMYAFMKLKRGLEFGIASNLLLALLMLLMLAAPIVVLALERAGQEAFARGLAYISFIWMALIFLFISTAFIFDIYRLIHFSARHLVQSPLEHLTLSLRSFCLLSIFLACAVVVYGYFEALNIRTDHLTITTDKLPPKIERLRIAQISDVHLGLIVGKSRLGRIVGKVRQARPDILVSTGDLVDGQMDSPEKLAEMLKSIPTRYGKYAITGNHEFYAGLERALAFTEKAGFVMLRGEGKTIEGAVNIAGVDDPARGSYRPEHATGEKAALENLPRDLYTILLKHQPVVNKASQIFFDLQLSGHTHKGQIFPFSLMTKLFYRTHTGLTTLDDNTKLYVNRGSGTWGPPIRFLALPEVTIIDIEAATGK